MLTCTQMREAKKRAGPAASAAAASAAKLLSLFGGQKILALHIGLGPASWDSMLTGSARCGLPASVCQVEGGHGGERAHCVTRPFCCTAVHEDGRRRGGAQREGRHAAARPPLHAGSGGWRCGAMAVVCTAFELAHGALRGMDLARRGALFC